MKTLMSMGVLYAIILLTSLLSIVVAEIENLTMEDNTIMQNNTTMPNTMSLPMSMSMDMPMDIPINMPLNQNGLPDGAATNVATML